MLDAINESSALSATPVDALYQGQRARIMRSLALSLTALETAHQRVKLMQGNARARGAQRLFEAASLLAEAALGAEDGAPNLEVRRRICLAAQIAETAGRTTR